MSTVSAVTIVESVEKSVEKDDTQGLFLYFLFVFFFFFIFSLLFLKKISFFLIIKGKLIEIVNTVSKTGRVIKRATMIPNTADLNTIKT